MFKFRVYYKEVIFDIYHDKNKITVFNLIKTDLIKTPNDPIKTAELQKIFSES